MRRVNGIHVQESADRYKAFADVKIIDDETLATALHIGMNDEDGDKLRQFCNLIAVLESNSGRPFKFEGDINPEELKRGSAQAVKDKIIDAYVNTRKSAKLISEEFGCTESTVFRFLKEENIQPRSRGGDYSTRFDFELIAKTYRTSNKSLGEIAEKFGCHRETVRKALKKVPA